MKELRLKIKNCNKCSNKCDICNVWRTEVIQLKKKWKEGHGTLKNRFNLTQPGLIHGICHVDGDRWKIQVKSRALNGSVKSSTIDVDTAYVNQEFGKAYAQFVYKKPALIGKKFHEVSGRNKVRLNDRAINGVKFLKGTEIKKVVTYDDYIFLDPEKEPIYDEVLLGGGQRRSKKKEIAIDGNQIITTKKNPKKPKTHAMQCRKELTDFGFTQGLKTAPVPKRKKVKRSRLVGTGVYRPDKWRVSHTDGTMTDDVEAEFISKEFGDEFTNYVQNAKSNKFTPRPQHANKVSHLDKWPKLIKLNAPRIKYMQEDKADLCIPKAFASVLHYVGFEKVAKDINDNFHSRKDCYSSEDPNFKALYDFGKESLPGWLQCKSNFISEIDWQIDLEQFDIFLGGLIGSDGEANHAVAIYNNWIFDANEKIAIPLCKEGLDYCVSTIDSMNEFISFTGGFYFREQGNRERLKRSCDSNGKLTRLTNYSSRKKTSKGVYVTSQKRKKIE